MSEFLKRIAEFSPKRLLLLAAELEERVRALEARNHAPIAIVGMGCRFPGGVVDAESFWKLLIEGRDAITEVPESRWDVERLYDPDPAVKGKAASKWGGFLDDPEMFDASFFGIAPIEAVSMDPQQRLLLEVSWEALEDAGIVPASLNGSRTGVYVGVCNTDYGQMGLRQPREALDAYAATGGAHAVVSGRVSYFLGLRGPSMVIDTACSASLVAVHEACQSLRLGESELALAGGVNLVLTPEVTIGMSRSSLMAPDGRCKTFAAGADGYVRSDGCGVVVLKRLEDAERDGDRVLGVIRGTAVNQDGRSSGLTAPNGPSQEDVIRLALKDAGLAPEALTYIEAHGTGTSLGDTIEMRALDETLGKGRSEGARLPVGSVKSNIGHSESAAGVAGLMKLVLALEHTTIPASLHCAVPNPQIDWESNRMRVPVEAEAWQRSEGHDVRAGAVSSFGFSGTNAHVIVSEAKETEAADLTLKSAEPQVITLSARSDAALRKMAGRLADRLRNAPELRLDDVAYTLAAGRTAFAHRAALLARSKEDLIEELQLLAQGDHACAFVRGVADGRATRVAFLFAGQGGERCGMGLGLLRRSEVFRAAVAEVDAALAGVIASKIEDVFRNEHDELWQSEYVQPALFAFQYGLARVWQSWGIRPHVVVGHSMGELVAATLAGVVSVADAARLVAARGRLTGELGDPGAMVAVAASEERVQAALRAYAADVSIAAVNGASSLVISGRADAVEQATQEFERANVRVKRLNISYGSHSPAMHRVLAPFYEEAAKIRYEVPRLPIIADLSGTMVEDDSVFTAKYWSDHLKQPVQFARCLERLQGEDCGLCVEMGPRAVLTTFGRERGDASCWVASADGREDDFEALQWALAQAFVAGAAVDWKAVFGGAAVRRVALPAYPFERERYWITDGAVDDSSSRLRSVGKESAEAVLAGVRLDAALPIFELEIGSLLPFHLEEYRVMGQAIVPASMYISLAESAAGAAGVVGEGVLRIRDFRMYQPLRLTDAKTRLQTMLTPGVNSPQETGKSHFQISSRAPGKTEWTVHATGEMVAEPVSQQDVRIEGLDLDQAVTAAMTGEEFYLRVEAQGVQLGASFRNIRELWRDSGVAVGLIRGEGRSSVVEKANFVAMPALLESCFHLLGAAATADDDAGLRVITGIRELSVHATLEGEMRVEARVEKRENGEAEGRIVVRSELGVLVAQASGVELRLMDTLFAFAEDSASALSSPLQGIGWDAELGESRVMALERAVRREAARVLGLRRGELPASDVRLADIGLDSLMAVTMRNRLQAMVGHGLPPMFAFEFPTPAAMAVELDMLLWSSGVVDEEHTATERDEIRI